MRTSVEPARPLGLQAVGRRMRERLLVSPATPLCGLDRRLEAYAYVLLVSAPAVDCVAVEAEAGEVDAVLGSALLHALDAAVVTAISRRGSGTTVAIAARAQGDGLAARISVAAGGKARTVVWFAVLRATDGDVVVRRWRGGCGPGR